MAEYRDVEPLRKQTVEFKTALKQFAKSSSFLMAYISGIDAVMEEIDKLPIADVQEKKDCEKCIHFDRQATEYPCSHCRNCYTDKFQPMPSCGARMDGEEK